MDNARIAPQDRSSRRGRMMGLLNQGAMDLIERAADGASAAEVGRRFFAALKPYGARAVYARSQSSADPNSVVAFSRISPPGWDELYAEPRFQDNFLLRAIRRRVTPFRWSDIELDSETDRELVGWLPAFAIRDGIAAPMHGPSGYVGVTSLAFEDLDALAPAERRAIGAAALVLHLRMLELTPQGRASVPKLSPRERDCLAHVAEGRTDWEIGERLGVSETTVISHLQSARRKLGARTRAQAVAQALLAGLI